MRKLFKKALACCLVAALALTCFVGALTVSAAAAGSAVVTGTTVTEGATEATVKVTLTSEDADGIHAAIVTLSSDFGAITSVVDADETNNFWVDEGDINGNTFLVQAHSNEVNAKVINLNVTFAAEAAPAVGTYAVAVTAGTVPAASWNENVTEFTTLTGADIVVESAVVECDHADAVAAVTTQPTKDAEGVMTYTCACGESWTEAIAKPVATTAVTFKGDIVVSSVVGANLTLSTKQMRDNYGAGSSYFITVNYKKYATGYVLEDKTATLTTADRQEGGVSTANKDVITFKDIAIYEMTLDFEMTAYFKNADGVVVGYRTFTTNVAKMALAYTVGANTKLLTALADMCVYGDEAQKYFASQNAGTDICDAVLPSTILGEANMAYASETTGMPAAGDYNNAKGSTKVVSSTGFVSGGQTLVIGASNQVSYTLRYDNYDWDDVEIKVSYEDSVKGTQEFTLTADELIANGTASNGQPKYTYYFKDLALYDCDKTVTMNMYYKGELELTSVYSFGNFVNANISNAKFTSILTAMELFSNSVGVQLGLAARW